MVKLLKKSMITLMLGLTLLSNITVGVSARSLNDDDWDKPQGWTYSKETSKWTYFEDGKMKIGWLNTGNTWYYFGIDGAMAKGVQCIDGKWYCFDNTGYMMKNCEMGNMQIGNDGVIMKF